MISLDEYRKHKPTAKAVGKSQIVKSKLKSFERFCKKKSPQKR